MTICGLTFSLLAYNCPHQGNQPVLASLLALSVHSMRALVAVNLHALDKHACSCVASAYKGNITQCVIQEYIQTTAAASMLHNTLRQLLECLIAHA